MPADDDALSFHPERLLAMEESADSDDPVDPQAWFVEAGDLFAQAYCVTLVQEVTVDEAFARVRATTSAGEAVTFDDLVEEAYEGQGGGDDWQLVGGCEVGGWTLLVEPNGYACTDVKRRRRLSKKTTAITMYSSVNGANEFSVSTDGTELLTFDMMFPANYQGDRPEGLVEDMVAAGFVVDGDEPEEADDDELGFDVAGAVLAERLTGIRLTVGLLNGLNYRTGLLQNR